MRTSTITTLFLAISHPTPAPTTAQLLSILGSNPTLQDLSLLGFVLPDDGGGGSSFRVSLHHLRELHLTGDPRRVFKLLSQLDHPRIMGHLEIRLLDCIPEDIPETIGPYLRDYLLRRGRSRSGLGLDILSRERSIEFRVGDVYGMNFSAPGPAQMEMFVEIVVKLDPVPPMDLLKEVTLNLVAHTPREEIIYFRATNNPVFIADLSVQLPHIRALHFNRTLLHLAFPKPTPGMDRELFPSVRHFTLDRVFARLDDWSPLTTFLSRRASSGSQILTLETIISNPPYPGAVEDIRRAVREFRMDGVCET
jgi:hypothetical protein